MKTLIRPAVILAATVAAAITFPRCAAVSCVWGLCAAVALTPQTPESWRDHATAAAVTGALLVPLAWWLEFLGPIYR